MFSRRGETGLKRFEELLGLAPKAGQTIEERRIEILARKIKKNPSLQDIRELLRTYAQEIDVALELTKGEISLFIGENTGNIGGLYQILDSLLGLDIYIHIACEIKLLLQMPEAVKQLELETSISYWNRSGALGWHLNGDAFLDGSKSFDAVLWWQNAELEQEVSAEIQEEWPAVVSIHQNLWYLEGAQILDGSKNLNARKKTEAI